MAKKNWTPLGFVTIDTGRLLLVDPMQADLPPEPDGEIKLPGGGCSAVVTETGIGDGRYLVEGRVIDCMFGRRVAEIRVRFLDEQGGWLGAN